MNRRVVFVSPEFPPCNLAAVHRSRIFVRHLPKFGWTPTVVTLRAEHYETTLDPGLAELVSEDTEIVRVRALATRPIRVVGDVSVRAFPWMLEAVTRLCTERRIDLVMLPIPPNYGSIIGPLNKRRTGVPYGVDYIDPWVHHWPASRRTLSKAWFAHMIGAALEPMVVRDASLITGVAPGYFEGALRRNRECHVVTAAMPYGAEAADFEHLRTHPREPYLFDPNDGNLHLVYAGALLPRGLHILHAFLRVLASINRERKAEEGKVVAHFIGTGVMSARGWSETVSTAIGNEGCAEFAVEHVERQPLLDVLNHMLHSTAVLVLGSDEPHYTASKVFQALLSRRPVFAVLHEASSAVEALASYSLASVVKISETRTIDSMELETRRGLLDTIGRRERAGVWSEADRFSGESVTRSLAAAMDRAIDRRGQG